MDSGIDDYASRWCMPWRLVVTAKRDFDRKICQIVDVRGNRGGGFYEIGEGTCTGGIVACVAQGHSSAVAAATTAAVASAGADAPVCAATGCGEPGTKQCARCRSVAYCSRECQAQHWRKGGHKQQCKQLNRQLEASKRLPTASALTMIDKLEARLFLDPGTCYGGYPPSKSPEDAKACAAFEKFMRGAPSSGGTLQCIELKWLNPMNEGSAAIYEPHRFIQDKPGLDWVARKLRTLEWH